MCARQQKITSAIELNAVERDATSRAVIHKHTAENANIVSRVCPCGCGRKMDPHTGLFFPIRAFNPMGHKTHTSKKR